MWRVMLRILVMVSRMTRNKSGNIHRKSHCYKIINMSYYVGADLQRMTQIAYETNAMLLLILSL